MGDREVYLLYHHLSRGRDPGHLTIRQNRATTNLWNSYWMEEAVPEMTVFRLVKNEWPSGICRTNCDVKYPSLKKYAGIWYKLHTWINYHFNHVQNIHCFVCKTLVTEGIQ